MEVKETEKFVVAKPIACRPGFSNLRSFSQLLSGTVNASPQAALSESADAVIRPTTVRFKPAYKSDLVEVGISSKVPESNVTSNVIYKPIAKLVSKRTISFLANLGNHAIVPPQEIAEVGSRIQPSNQVKHQTADLALDFRRDFTLGSEEIKVNATLENCEDDSKSLLVANNTSYDGHSWRKYGQKQVKGSEYPRSYYKCTHPNCPVKKKVEKTPDGQIAEVVYKGDHNHSNPQPLNSTPYDGNAQKLAHDSTQIELMNQTAERAKGHEVMSENQKFQNDNTESSVQSAFCGTGPLINDPVEAAICNNASVSASNNSLGFLSGECEEVSESLEVEGDEFKSKRRKHENQLVGARTVGEASSVVQNNTDSEIIGDGFRWRKYGQKVVKGKIYPRSYYRCTSVKCNVRKYVERTSEDPGTFITTYEGRHNHDMPIKGTNHADASSKTRTKNKSLTIGNG